MCWQAGTAAVNRPFLGAFFFLFMTTAAFCQEQPLPLTLAITTEHCAYKAGEDIRLTATLTNNLDKEMVLFWSQDKAVLISDKFNVVSATFPERIATKYKNLYIKPKESVQEIVLVRNDLAQAWVYTLSLLYASPKDIGLDFKTTGAQEIFSGTLISNMILVTLKDGAASSAVTDRAMGIAAEYLAKQTYQDQFLLEPVRFNEQKDFVDVYFRRKAISRPPEGIIRVNKKTWQAAWMPTE
jgi:hypothetical protein